MAQMTADTRKGPDTAIFDRREPSNVVKGDDSLEDRSDGFIPTSARGGIAVSEITPARIPIHASTDDLTDRRDEG
jgi:hypothetical protein